MVKKGVCKAREEFFGVATVSARGQVALPVDACKALGIGEGERLLVLARSDGLGLSLVKASAVQGFMRKIREGE